ncbi:MAG: DUF4041 domain-containing protein, partial [Firmicutes bacterium]|nr:DUF4041 domain-containing protein [Bacillota bacterium]
MGLFGPSKKEIALQQEVDRLKELLTPEHREIENLQKEIDNLNVKKNGLSDSIFNLEKKIGTLTEQSSNIEKNIKLAQKELVGYHLDIEMQEYGIYKPHYDFANSSLYKDALTDVRNRQKECIKKDQACNGNYGWTVNGSATKGKTMVKDTQKLLLRAFNVECDDIVENIKVTNYDSSVERIYKISEQISKLGKIMDISITNKYIKLKIE